MTVFRRTPVLARVAALVLLAVGALAAPASAADPAALYKSGDYAGCVAAADAVLDDRPRDEAAWLLKMRAQLATGQYAEALKTYQGATARVPASVAVRLLGSDVLRANDRPREAQQNLFLVRELAARDPQRYSGAADRVAVGRALLALGADARQVLELFYDSAKAVGPTAAEPHVASGELALKKEDYAVAAESFQEAAKRAPDDPDVHYGLARAYHDDADRARAALTRALELNPRHVDSLLLQADRAIDHEAYEPAEALLARVLEVNPREPRAWAYRAVLAHLAGDGDREQSHRAAALSTWKTNPEVDHLIGLKLSQKYRFTEGQAYQRLALGFDAGYLPAKVQLSQDLLRLGQDEEGWRLAAEVFEADPYNVVTYNLNTLHDNLAAFRTLRAGRFVVRMDEREAAIYGSRVLDLLTRAEATLCEAYGVELAGPVTVEIFPQQKDFAIRTFGLPGGAGYLGVCFGNVITVNSPASRVAHPANWEAVLWHEFAHVVTLHKTRNRMPRWLSEGISVYEERRANAAWGQSMNPQYRKMILDGQATPVSKLSGAFLNPESPLHVQFAYFESAMVVEHVVQRFGLPALQRVLDDLGRDVPINEALARHTEPIERLDETFAAWLRARAEALAPGVDWAQPEVPLDAGSEAFAAWNREHPTSFLGLLGEGRALLAERKWVEAKDRIGRAVALCPEYAEPGGPYVLLAAVHRELGETDQERANLEKHAALDADAVEARVRLMEIAESQNDLDAVRRAAEEVLAINPLIPTPHRYLARSAEATGDRSLAIASHRTLLRMDPLDPADHHYRLARLLSDDGQLDAARREVVRALEEAPRFRDAHRLLLELADRTTGPTTAPAVP